MRVAAWSTGPYQTRRGVAGLVEGGRMVNGSLPDQEGCGGVGGQWVQTRPGGVHSVGEGYKKWGGGGIGQYGVRGVRGVTNQLRYHSVVLDTESPTN